MRVVLIGGSKGLGLEIRSQLEKAGHTVLALSRNSTLPLDLTWEEDKIKSAMKQALGTLGGIDWLVISSGLGSFERPDVEDEKVKEIFQTNLFGVLAAYRACLKELKKSQGKVCFISSTCARKPGSGGLSYYAASKGGLNSFVLNEAKRLAKDGVGMFSVSPSWFDSPMTEELVPEVKDAAIKAIPFGRFGTVAEIAEAVVSMLRWSNWCVAGSNFELSGGL